MQQPGIYPTGEFYCYEVLYTKFVDQDYIAANCDEGTILTLGSSELETYDIPEHPVNTFYGSGYDLSLMLVGQGYCQSLWHAIFAGSIEQGLENRNVALIISPQWFVAEGVGSEAFSSLFSQKEMQAFLENPDISQNTKDKVLARVAGLLADPTPVNRMVSNDLLDRFDSAINTRVVNTKTSYAAIKNASKFSGPEVEKTLDYRTIDWGAWLARAGAEGEVACTNNGFGIYDEYYTTYCANTAPGSFAGTDYTVSPEYDDLQLFLDVCRETGLNPLVVSVPLNGAWADYTGVSQEMRDGYYANIRALCSENGAACADLSVYEGEKYFIGDAMHLGWKGWVRVEKAICEFNAANQG